MEDTSAQSSEMPDTSSAELPDFSFIFSDVLSGSPLSRINWITIIIAAENSRAIKKETR